MGDTSQLARVVERNASRIIEALVKIWRRHWHDAPQLQAPAIQSLEAWTTNFPEQFRAHNVGEAPLMGESTTQSNMISVIVERTGRQRFEDPEYLRFAGITNFSW